MSATDLVLAPEGKVFLMVVKYKHFVFDMSPPGGFYKESPHSGTSLKMGAAVPNTYHSPLNAKRRAHPFHDPYETFEVTVLAEGKHIEAFDERGARMYGFHGPQGGWGESYGFPYVIVDGRRFRLVLDEVAEEYFLADMPKGARGGPPASW